MRSILRFPARVTPGVTQRSHREEYGNRRHDASSLAMGTLQIPQDTHRCHNVKASVRVHEYPDDTLAIFHGPRCLARYDSAGKQFRPKRKAAA